MGALSGSTARRQAALTERAQDEQRQRLAEERSRVEAVEEGQRTNAQTGGGGLLAYVDEATRSLFGQKQKKLGGDATGVGGYA